MVSQTNLENQKKTDICINDNGGRQFMMEDETNPNLYTLQGCHVFRYEEQDVTVENKDGEKESQATFLIRKSTEEELATELAEIIANTPAPEPTEQETIDQELLETSADLMYELSMMGLGVE